MPSKKFNFCLISPQNICPKVFGIISIFFGKCETSLCSFWSTVSFAWELSQWILYNNMLLENSMNFQFMLNLKISLCFYLPVRVWCFVSQSWPCLNVIKCDLFCHCNLDGEKNSRFTRVCVQNWFMLKLQRHVQIISLSDNLFSTHQSWTGSDKLTLK